MTRDQIENLYRVNGLTDFRLKEASDLLRIHGIDYKKVDGYSGLDDGNREVFERFIVNIFNASGIDTRTRLVPTGIYLVEDIDYLAKEDPKQDYYNIAGGIVSSIDRYGRKNLLHKWEDEEFIHLERIEDKPKTYLRFEYISGLDGNGEPRETWLHVISKGKEWY